MNIRITRYVRDILSLIMALVRKQAKENITDIRVSTYGDYVVIEIRVSFKS